jgi:hypothetical protein
MMPVMVKEADPDWIGVSDDCEAIDATEDHDVVQLTLL